MEIINPNGLGGNPFGDIQPMGCGTEALAPPNMGGGGAGGGPVGCPPVVICYPDCPILD